MIERYVQLPVEVLAVQFDGGNGQEIADWINEHPRVNAQLIAADVEYGHGTVPVNATDGKRVHAPAVVIYTPWGDWCAERGDWVVRETYGKFVTVEPDVFDEDYARYEPPFEDACHTATLPSGEILRVRGGAPMNQTQQAALGVVVEATRKLLRDSAQEPDSLSWETVREGFGFTPGEEAEIARLRAAQLAAQERPAPRHARPRQDESESTTPRTPGDGF